MQCQTRLRRYLEGIKKIEDSEDIVGVDEDEPVPSQCYETYFFVACVWLITVAYVAYCYAVFDRLGTILPAIMSVWPK